MGAAHGVEHQRNVSLAAVRRVSERIPVLDAYAMTLDRCEESEDGIHFHVTNVKEARSLVGILAGMQVGDTLKVEQQQNGDGHPGNEGLNSNRTLSTFSKIR